MFRRVGVALGLLVVLALVWAGAGLWLAKRAIVALAPPLPTAEEVLAFDAHADLPVHLAWINPASQKMPRSAVLQRALDPTPTAAAMRTSSDASPRAIRRSMALASVAPPARFRRESARDFGRDSWRR